MIFEPRFLRFFELRLVVVGEIERNRQTAGRFVVARFHVDRAVFELAIVEVDFRRFA